MFQKEQILQRKQFPVTYFMPLILRVLKISLQFSIYIENFEAVLYTFRWRQQNSHHYRSSCNKCPNIATHSNSDYK